MRVIPLYVVASKHIHIKEIVSVFHQFKSSDSFLDSSTGSDSI